MIVKCERCGTRSRLDDSKIGTGGIKVRCSRCQHVFKVSHPLFLDEKDIFGEKQEGAGGPSVKEWEEGFTLKPPPEEVKAAPPAPEEATAPTPFIPSPTQEEKVSPKEAAAEEPSLQEEIFPFRAAVPEEAPVKKERKISTTFLLSMLLIVVIFAAFYYWTQREASISLFESIYERISHLMGEKKEQKLFLLYLRGNEQKLKGGKVFVIQGKLANRSGETKKYVKLKGLLFNKEGKVVAHSIGYCGRALTNKKIKEFTYASLKSSFGFIPPAKAPPVPAKRSVPFTIIFFSPPAGATEYKVEIAEAPPIT